MRIIGVNGFKRSGKDSVGKILLSLVDNAERDAFADDMKLSAARSLGLQVQDLENLKTDGLITVEGPGVKHKITVREYFELFGTEGHRETFGDDFWIDKVLERKRNCDLLVVTDVRFVNEAEAIRAKGGEIWNVRRPSTMPGVSLAETPLPETLIDARIVNDGSLADLKNRVKAQLFI